MTRKGISNVVASLFFLAIVVAFGTIVLFNGITGINAFNLSLTPYQGDPLNANLESILIEHVRFNPQNNQVTLSIRNTGTQSFTVDSIKITKINTQELILGDTSISLQVQPGTVVDYVETPTLTHGSNTWSDSYYSKSSYSIGVVSTRGTSVLFMATPFNT